MKKRNFVMAVVVAIILTGCVVKSLKPFYTEETLAYDGTLLGKWKDNKDKVWKVVPMMKFLDSAFMEKEINLDNKVLKGDKLKNFTKKIKENNSTVKIDELVDLGGNKGEFDSIKVKGKVQISKNKHFFENKELQKIYDKAYLFMEDTENQKDMEVYIAVPFKIKGQIFLDFTPFEDMFESGFMENHHIGIHTLAKFERIGESFKLSWLSDSAMKKLFEQKKIRIKHEKIGLEKEDILLTASSEELQKFIAKYMDLEVKDKWNGTSLTFNRIK